MAWHPDNRQWIVIAVTFVIAACAVLFPRDVTSIFGLNSAYYDIRMRNALNIAALVVVAGGLVVWFLNGHRRK
jgi:hypothetical protein